VIPVAERVDGPLLRTPPANDDMEQEMVRLQVKGPAAGLLLASVLFVLAGLVGFVAGISISVHENRSEDAIIALLLGMGALVVGPLLGALVYYGARQMVRLQGYEWAILASILTILALPSPGFIVGFLGLWAFITLRRPTVRMAFARQALGRPIVNAPPPPTRGSLSFSCHVHGGLNEAKGLLHLHDDALVMEYRILYLGMASGKTQEARIPLEAMQSVEARVRWYGTQFVIVPVRLRGFDHVPGMESGEVRLHVARADREKAEALAARVMARLNGNRPSAIGNRPEQGNARVAAFAEALPHEAAGAELEAPRRRGPVRRMFHSFAKAAKNLFVETTVYTPADSFVAPTSPPLPAPTPAPAPAPPPVVDAISVSDERVRHELIRMQVRPPAIALTIIGVLNLLFWWNMAIVAWAEFSPRERSNEWIPICLGMAVPVLASVIILLVGARRMRQLRGYGLSWFTTIWASLPWGPAFLFGIPIGFWARRVLRRPEVRDVFVRNTLAGGAMFPVKRPLMGSLATVALPILLALGTIMVLSIVALSAPRQHHQPARIFDTWPQPFFRQRYRHIGEAIRNNDKNWVQDYVRGGGKINERTSEGKPPLAYAAEAGNAEMTRYLLDDQNADVNGRDASGFTPLHYAARGGSEETMRVLLERRAQHPVTAPNGFTPLMEAALVGRVEVVQCLLDHYSVPAARRASYISAQTNARTNALMLAASKGHIDIVQLFLERGADVEAVDDNGETALFKAAAGGYTACVGLLLPKTPKSLLDQPNKQGETALTAAAWKGSREITDLLYKAGSVEPPRLTFCRAYQFAMAKRYAEAVPILEKLAAKDKLPTSEKLWTMEFGGFKYEIPLPYLLVHLLLADCYGRVGQEQKKDEALKACQATWPKSTEQLPLYTLADRRANWRMRVWVLKSEIEKHIDSTGRLPLPIQVSYSIDGSRVGFPRSGTKEGVTH
jgi:ankyrin repeat protein